MKRVKNIKKHELEGVVLNKTTLVDQVKITNDNFDNDVKEDFSKHIYNNN